MVEPEATGRRLDGAIAIGTKLGVLACGPVAGIFRVRSGSLHVNDGKYVDAVVLIVLAIIVVEVLGEQHRAIVMLRRWRWLGVTVDPLDRAAGRRRRSGANADGGEISEVDVGAERVMLASGQVSALVGASRTKTGVGQLDAAVVDHLRCGGDAV
jgi:hypothetical protein